MRNYEGDIASPSDLCDLLVSMRQFAGLLEDGLEQGRWSDELGLHRQPSTARSAGWRKH